MNVKQCHKDTYFSEKTSHSDAFISDSTQFGEVNLQIFDIRLP